MENPSHSISSIAEKLKLFDLLSGSSTYSKSEPDHFQKFKVFENIKRLVHRNKSLITLPQDLLDLKIFTHYDTCEIHFHKKGGLEYKVLSKRRGQELKEDSFNDLQNYYNVLNQIKKSKNKLFESNFFPHFNTFIIGTFLSKVFEFQQHNIILILSNSGFLYPSKEEQNYFDEFFHNLQPILESRVSSHSSLYKYQTLAKTIENIPLHFEVLNTDSTLLFRSSSEYREEGKLRTQEIELSDHNLLVLFEHNNQRWATDILHFQRVKLLGELLNTLKHELSNPLFGLKLSSSILSDEITDEDEIKLLEEIKQNCQRCQNIIQDFQYLYDERNENVHIDLKKLIREVLTLTKSETRMIRKRVIIEDDRDIFIKSNPTFLTQILFNLVINSAHAIEESEPSDTHCITIQVETPSLDKLSISVSDTGTGIGSDKNLSIFDPFFTTKEKGTGLGLPICQNLAKKLNGRLVFENNSPLPGVTFSLNLTLEYYDQKETTHH